ncbi:redoxin family protein [Alteromonas sp. CYL-A6]|uniref:redoxin family protein n=1 Tax=Alteromonas nitratireducens TaxID=3390813 RepID=UPI0034C2667E
MSLSLGPLALPVSALLVLLSAYVFYSVLMRTAARRFASHPEYVRQAGRVGILILAVTFVTARASFVAHYWNDYQRDLWQMINVRDGGFDATWGILAGLFVGGLMIIRYRRLSLSLAVSALVSLSIFYGGQAALEASYRDSGIPSVNVMTPDGDVINLVSFRGQPLVVNYWASWCPPCRREMPVLSNAQAHRNDVQIVFVNQGENAQTVTQYLHAEGLTLNNLLFDRQQQAAKTTGSAGLPTTLFFDARGKLIKQHMGELSAASLNHYLSLITSE